MSQLLNVNAELSNVKDNAQQIIDKCNTLQAQNLDEYLSQEKVFSEAIILSFYNYFKHVTPTSDWQFPIELKNSMVAQYEYLAKLRAVFTNAGHVMITLFI